jgi:hypothetical protein
VLIGTLGVAIIGLSSHVHSGSLRSEEPGFHFRRGNGGLAQVFAVGDVNDVLRGYVSPETVRNYWSAEGIIGFGAGAVGPLSGAGEAFYANGYAFVRQTDNGTSNYFQTISDRQYRTPFSMHLSEKAGETSDGVAAFEVGDGVRSIRVSDFYERIYEAVQGSPFCFHGFINFQHMDAIAVSKAPIYGESLFGALASANGYYAMPSFKVSRGKYIFFC